MWCGTSRNFRPVVQPLRATTSASSCVAQACMLPASSRFSTAMKWLLPEPKLPCKYAALLPPVWTACWMKPSALPKASTSCGVMT